MTAKELQKYGIGTRLIHAAAHYDHGKVRSHIPPIFQTVNFDYESVDEGMSIFLGEKEGYFYTRNGNPSSDMFAHLIAMIEEADAGLSAASGMAAISSAILALVHPGDEIVSSKNIYGGTRNWLVNQLAPFGVSVRFVDISDLGALNEAMSEKTKILYTEVLGSPDLVVADIESLSTIVKDNDALLMVDSTFTPPPVIMPLTMGADIVVHSTTKYINGHGDAIGGAVVGDKEIIEKINNVLKLYGGVISPFNAWLGIRGMKTLSLRIEKHCANALAIAEFLNGHDKIKTVYYPGLSGHAQHVLAKTQLYGFGGMLAFKVKGGLESGKKLMDSVKLCSFTTSLGEIDTLIIHPASTSHVSLSRGEREALGITDDLVRLSVGIEDVDDLRHDLEQALEKI
jgi:methionine-gamma-lyase